MKTPPLVVRLHALGTDVDVRVTGHDPEGLAAALRERWHLALRDGDATSASTTSAGTTSAGTTSAGTTATRAPSTSTTTPLVVEAGVIPPDEDALTPWNRQDTVVHDHDRPRLLQRLTQSITHAVITARTGDLLMLHAAGLAHPTTGATAAFVAPGNTGKTTLCRTLGPGRAYVSDETVGVRRDGTITPYLKPLSTRRPDWAGTKDEQAPGAAGLAAPTVTPWLAGLVLLRREEDHPGPPRVEEVELFDAVLELTPESSGFMRTEGPLRWLAEVIGRTGGVRRVVYAEARDLEPLAAEICGRVDPW